MRRAVRRALWAPVALAAAYLGFRVAFSVVWHVGVHRRGLRFNAEIKRDAA